MANESLNSQYSYTHLRGKYAYVYFLNDGKEALEKASQPPVSLRLKLWSGPALCVCMHVCMNRACEGFAMCVYGGLKTTSGVSTCLLS